MKICRITPSYQKVRNASNELLARTHHIKCKKAENKLIDSAQKYETYVDLYSLKAVPEFFRSVKHAAKMLGEKLISAYYYKK